MQGAIAAAEGRLVHLPCGAALKSVFPACPRYVVVLILYDLLSRIPGRRYTANHNPTSSRPPNVT